uniref:Glutaredoxin-dependent peroxiredoxin n=1 Tax=Tamarix hispida TaxID=189793 RepID=I0CC95_9CARY|nr:type II peroxiredoxin [Tamarix hispida]
MASFTMSKLLSLPATSATAAALFPTKTLPSIKPSPSTSFCCPLRIKPATLRLHSTKSAPTPIAATITVGTKLPSDKTLSYFDSAGEVQTTTICDLTKSKKTILFAVPGAFTPTCSQQHLPGFVGKSAELKSKGVDLIACVSVNDAFVMRAWKENLGINDEVLLLSDGNGEFTRAIGAELDLSDKPVGLGIRSRRYSMLVEDGVVKVLNTEEGGAFTSSGAEDLLKVL